HLLLEPGEPGSGLVYKSRCSEDDLDRNWQRLILSHLGEKVPIGVLIGAELTDMKITLIAGRGHNKHTEGGDFRQATFRALRQGLRKAKKRLLEPMYEYRLEVPKELIGRAMSDLQMMNGRFIDPWIDEEFATLEGTAPVATMRNYHSEVMSYTKGLGRLFTTFSGYEPCHNEEEMIAASSYSPDEDMQNPSGSVFCAHGAGFQVEWDQVENYIHIENQWQALKEEAVKNRIKEASSPTTYEHSDDELAAIFHKTYGESKRDQHLERSRQVEAQRNRFESIHKNEEASWEFKKVAAKEKYLLVDGYNIIFAWEDLKDLATTNMDGARNKLQDLLCNYQSYQDIKIIVVYDAYRVQGGRGDSFDYHNIHIVYTKEAETADQYIERLVHKIGRTYEVTVATSDALEQMIILGRGGIRMSAEGLRKLLENVGKEIQEQHLNQQENFRNYPFRQ
ncbi:MAG: NYN domain-containing protein, partial [Vallitaleaceae bacterium]|nr:NYN domain-containing protein [Vallitaleaceae bacterium]